MIDYRNLNFIVAHNTQRSWQLHTTKVDLDGLLNRVWLLLYYQAKSDKHTLVGKQGVAS